MENSHNGPKHAKNYENNNLELFFLIVQLDKDLFTMQNDFDNFFASQFASYKEKEI